jgi:hypothetical protein
MQKALSRAIRLDPFSVQHKLRDGPLAYVTHNFLSRARGIFYIDLGVGDLVLIEEPFGFAAIAAPRSGINQQFHLLIIMLTEVPEKSTVVRTRLVVPLLSGEGLRFSSRFEPQRMLPQNVVIGHRGDVVGDHTGHPLTCDLRLVRGRQL